MVNVYHPSIVGNVVIKVAADPLSWNSLKIVLYAGAEVESLFVSYESRESGLGN